MMYNKLLLSTAAMAAMVVTYSAPSYSLGNILPQCEDVMDDMNSFGASCNPADPNNKNQPDGSFACKPDGHLNDPPCKYKCVAGAPNPKPDGWTGKGHWEPVNGNGNYCAAIKPDPIKKTASLDVQSDVGTLLAE